MTNEIKIRSDDIRIVPISQIIPNPKNRNIHSVEQIDRLCKIIEYQGFRSPLIVSNQSGLLVSGHGRLECAKKLGLECVPVLYQDFESEDQEYAAMVSENSIASWAELDLSGINTDLAMLGPDFDIDLLGIKNFEIDFADKELGDPEDVPQVPKVTNVVLGDLFYLGNHTLLCGDSTNVQHVERLMAGSLADLWITDAPYGVSYQSNGAKDKHDKIENDDLPLDEMVEFWTAVATNALIACSDKAPYYWFACQGGDQMMMMMALGNANWKVRHELIWVKDSLVMGRCDYHYKHEPILYGWKKNGTHEWYADRKQTSVLEFARPKKSEDHPTMKPAELIAYLMGNSSKSGDIVLDAFGGSGTTLIAAEQINRKARLIEISPKYCQVILDRWSKFTDLDPVHENGKRWSDIKAEPANI